MPHTPLFLQSVLYVPELDCNLLSVSKLNSNLKCETKFLAQYFVFQALESGKTIGSAKLCSRLYLLKAPSPLVGHQLNSKCQSVKSLKSCFHSNKDNEVMLRHYQLGHPNFMYLRRLFSSQFINKNPNLFQCDVCQLSKHTHSTYSHVPYNPSHPFFLIYGDIWGPNKIPNLTGARWILLLVDDHTRLSWTFLMKDKSETSNIFKNFHVMIKNQFHTDI